MRSEKKKRAPIFVSVTTNIGSSIPQRESAIVDRRSSLSVLARRHGLDRRRVPLICSRNGRWISQKDWSKTRARPGDVINFVVLPRGGGTTRIVGGLIATVLAAVVAPFLAPTIAAAFGVTSAVGTAAILAGTTAVLAAGGNILLNAVLPPIGAQSNVDAAVAYSDAAAPTYSFTASSQQNTPRLGGTIPVLYGRMRIVPDLAATAWSEWEDGYQKLYQTLVLTQGELSIEKIELGRTPIDVFEEIETQVVAPNSSVTLFESEVYQSRDVRGIALLASNELPTAFIDDGTYGPFALTPPGVSTNRMGIDIAFPRGLYYSSDSGALTAKTVTWKIEAQRIDDAGAAIGSWVTVANETYTSGGTNTSSSGTFLGGAFSSTRPYNSPLTVSYRYTLPTSSRWQIRVTRTDTKDLSTRAGHDLSWSGLRGFLGTGNYGNVTCLAIAITASSTVNDATIRQIAVTGTRKLPVWNGTSWSAPTATRSIAAAIADMLKNQTYGGKRADTDFDLAHLTELDAIWSGRGDTFDIYISQARTLWSAIQAAAKAGRAVPYHQAGLVRFHRDGPQTIPNATFSRENIRKGTFSQTFIMPNPEADTDGIELRYFDERVWNFASIFRKNDGSTDAPVSPAPSTLEGVVQVQQATNEAEYAIAADRYRRVLVEFETDLEGLTASRGDLILISHDVPRWGQSTRVLDYDEDAKIVTLFGRPDYSESDGPWFVRFRDRQNRPSAEIEIEIIDDLHVLLLDDPTYPGGEPFDVAASASDSELTHVLIGRADDRPKPAIFLSASARKGSSSIAVTAVLDHSGVYVN